MSFNNVNEHAFKAWSSTTASDTYEQFRPDYNSDSVGFLLEKLGALKTHSAPFTILELGAGTGKFTRAVLRYVNEHSVKNVKIISTDPIKEMCDKFKEMVPNIEMLQRRADDLGLPSNSADAVVAVHCLHWFANSESMNEIHRVLKDKGMLGMIWNVQDRSISWIKAIEDMQDVKYMEKKIPDIYNKHWHLPIKNHGGFGTIHEDRSHQYNMELDFRGVIEIYKSISVVSSASDSDKEAMLSEIRNVMRTDPNVKDQEKYTYNFIVHIEWSQKGD